MVHRNKVGNLIVPVLKQSSHNKVLTIPYPKFNLQKQESLARRKCNNVNHYCIERGV